MTNTKQDTSTVGIDLAEARAWIADCFSDVDVDDLSDEQVRAGVARHYDGGVAGFVADSASL